MRHSGTTASCNRRPSLGDWYLYTEGEAQLLFTENETNTERAFGVANSTPYVKDAFHNYIIHGQDQCDQSGQTGTKVTADYSVTIPAAESAVVRLRLSRRPARPLAPE